MLCGKTPFYNENRGSMFKNICENEIRYPNNIYLSKECKDLISCVFELNWRLVVKKKTLRSYRIKK